MSVDRTFRQRIPRAVPRHLPAHRFQPITGLSQALTKPNLVNKLRECLPTIQKGDRKELVEYRILLL